MLVDWLRTVSFALVLFVIVRAVLVEAFKIPSGSMEGTLLVGDFLLVNKLVYGAEIPLTHSRLPALRAPERGDVVVFSWPTDPTKNFVKRVVGVAGDTLEMRDGVLVRNGAAVNEAYVSHTEPGSDPGGDEFRWQRDFLVRAAGAVPTGYHPSRNNWGPIQVPPARPVRSRRQPRQLAGQPLLGFPARFAGPWPPARSSTIATHLIRSLRLAG